MEDNEELSDQHGSKRHVPFLAHIAGVKDERTYYSKEVGASGRSSLQARGWHKLVLPAGLAVGVSIMGYKIMGPGGLCCGLFFLVMNAWIQSIANPLISEKRVMHEWTGGPALFAIALELVSGTFAAALVAWFLFQPAIDQRHREDVAIVMLASQEKQDLTFAEGALEKERASQLSKQQVNTSGIDRAVAAYTQAQETAANANAAYQKEITSGQGGRQPGDGPAAKALRQAMLDAQAAEARAKSALDEARQQASGTISVPENLTDAYTNAKGKYEAKEQSLIEAGPGLLKIFWWIIGLLHTNPLPIVLLFLWTVGEASGVITHAFAHSNVYERARLNALEVEAAERREARRIRTQRITDSAEHKAEIKTARSDAKIVTLEAKDAKRRR